MYGHHGAIHNFYLLLGFSPLTLWLGGYGLILGLVLLHVIAVARVAGAATLDTTTRLVVLAGALGPVAFYVFDHPAWGFHPELCYPPLALLFALDLREGRRGRALLFALLIVLVKEDGAVVCAAVLAAFFADRFFRPGLSRAQDRQLLRSALLSLGAAALAFALGLALLAAVGRGVEEAQVRAGSRVGSAIDQLLGTLGGSVPHYRRGRAMLRVVLASYLSLALVILLPLGARLLRGLGLFLLASPPLLIVLLISQSGYSPAFALWPPRVAAFLALVLACLVFAAAPRRNPDQPPLELGTAWTAAFVLGSWALQGSLLAQLGYTPLPRLRADRLWRGTGTHLAEIPAPEVRFLRCVAHHLPKGVPVSSPGGTHPIFHHQSIVFEGIERFAPQPRVRIVSSGEPRTANGGSCRGPQAGGLAVEGDCALLAGLASCAPDESPAR